MVFNLFVTISASLLIVLRRILLLIFYPYTTMRRISLEKDKSQIGIIMLISFLYFMFAYKIRHGLIFGMVAFGVFVILFYGTTLFFYFSAKQFNKDITYTRFLFTYSYTLIPTFFWFFTSALFFVLLPPPRTISMWGKGFSVVYLSYSISLLVWKLILVYFSLRFAARLGLIRILYIFLLYLTIFIPLSVLLYHLHIFRIPFI